MTLLRGVRLGIAAPSSERGLAREYRGEFARRMSRDQKLNAHVYQSTTRAGDHEGCISGKDFSSLQPAVTQHADLVPE
jgi:hypothetical protein